MKKFFISSDSQCHE